MLSAKYENIHGMKDSRWRTEDKITQFRGLLKLYKRDQKIEHFDREVLQKKQTQQLKQLKNQIESSRDKLQNAILGDKQKLRNTLAEHRNMQLAYLRLPTPTVVDHIYQSNFNQRKQLDRLRYQMKLWSQKLIDTKLHYSIMEDNITYRYLLKFPIEEYAGIVTGKVQDAILRKEAALSVQDTYLRIIKIMKKDALYYDAILSDIKKDGLNQNACLIYATEMGQLATEYLDDRREEFEILERLVKRDIKIRLEDLKAAHAECYQIENGFKYLIRRDSDINIGKVIIPAQPGDEILFNELNNLEEVLETLKQTTAAPDFNSIYPSFEEQLRQQNRLMTLTAKTKANHDNLLNKLNHATMMKDLLYNTMIETTNEYKQEKQRLLTEIENQKKKKAELTQTLLVRNALVAKVKISLVQLQAKCKIVGGPVPQKKRPVSELQTRLLQSGEPLFRVAEPEKEEGDAIRMIDVITSKITKLVAQAAQGDPKVDEDEALRAFEGFILNQCKTVPITTTDQDEVLMEEIQPEVSSSVPTREEIKQISAAIVRECEAEDDLAPGAPKKKV